MNDFQQEIEVAAKKYADGQIELVSLQLQRAFLEGAMAGIRAHFTREAMGAANEEHAS